MKWLIARQQLFKLQLSSKLHQAL